MMVVLKVLIGFVRYAAWVNKTMKNKYASKEMVYKFITRCGQWQPKSGGRKEDGNKTFKAYIYFDVHMFADSMSLKYFMFFLLCS